MSSFNPATALRVARLFDPSADTSEEYVEVDDLDILDERPVEPVQPPSQVRVMDVVGMGAGEELDIQTELDLGMACRDMGLVDAALLRFRKVLSLGGRRVLCRMMIALCHADCGEDHQAISELKNALYLQETTESEAIALWYELGRIYERLGNRREALYYYQRVVAQRPGFRDACHRVARLEAFSG
jgi:hypothetical protein